MLARALVLLLGLLIATPIGSLGEPYAAQDLSAEWTHAHDLVHRGAYAEAQAVYASLAAQLGPGDAARALLLQAQAALAEQDTDSAQAAVQQLLADFPASDQVPIAYLVLEQVRRAAGDWQGALAALDTFEALPNRPSLGPYPSIRRAQCLGKLEDWAGEISAAGRALAVDGGGSRLARIEALERAAEGELKLARKQAALDDYNRALELAGTRAYRAEMLFTTGTLAHALDQDDLAVERLRAVVVDYADQARAPGALDALEEIHRSEVVSPYQAGLARLNGKQYAHAVAQLEQVDAADSDWGAAQVARADALVKSSRDEEARQALTALGYGGTPIASAALLRLGGLQERAGELAAAEASYAVSASLGQDRSNDALFRLGFTRFLRQNMSGALDAFRTALNRGSLSPTLQANLWYWSARALPSGSAESIEALNRAAAAAPDSYYALRALEQLNPVQRTASANASAAWLAPNPKDAQQHAAWLAAQNTTAERVAREVAASPGLQLADTLLSAGLRTEAGWEIQGVLQQYAQDKDLAHLGALGDWTAQRELPNLTLQTGRLERDLGGYASLPRALQKQVYPIGYADLIQEQAAQFGLDPLLMLALVRQESSFDPRAQSGAQAIGLAQVVPSTGRDIARRLGHEDFSTRDLFRPAMNLQYGSWFLSTLLGQYHGRLFPALAAYNAGGGNVARWLDQFGDDPDVLVERVPLVETQSYLRIVYDNFLHYQALYRDP